MDRISWPLAGSLALVLILMLAIPSCLRKIPLDRAGVKSKQLGQGVIERDFGPGYAWVFPWDRLDIIDSRLQTLSLSPKGHGRDVDDRLAPLRAQDQYEVGVDVTVLYRIVPGAAHQVVTDVGLNQAFRIKFADVAKQVIWDTMGKMNTEDFYNVRERIKISEETRQKLEVAVKDTLHIEVWDVLIRAIEYDPEFEKRLIQKQLFEQDRLLFTSKTRTEREKQKVQVLEMETEAAAIQIHEEQVKELRILKAQTQRKEQEILAKARRESETIKAEADRVMRQRTAQGELEKTLALARGEKAINAAYQGAGGQLYLAKKILENIEIGHIEINTNKINPFDVGQMLKMIGADIPVPKKSGRRKTR